MVTKAVEDDELEEAFDELDDAFEEAFEPELGELFEFELDEELSPPLTVSPTEPLTAVTMPLMEAVSTVPLSAF